MKNKNFQLTVAVFLGLTLLTLSITLNKVIHEVDQQTIFVCETLAPIRKEQYKNTEWKDMDFYQSCIENVKFSSPLGR
jgi:hypothetical protein